MKRFALIALLVAAPVHAGDGYEWTHTYPHLVGNVEIHVQVATLGELRRDWIAAGKTLAYGKRIYALSVISKKSYYGPGILDYNCVIKIVNRTDWQSKKHERRHCNGWTH